MPQFLSLHLTIVLHVMVWTLFCDTLSLSNNLDYIFRLETHQQKIQQRLNLFRSNCTDHDEIYHNTIYPTTIRSDIVRNVSYSKGQYYRGGLADFSLFELLKLIKLRPDEALRLIRRKRSTNGKDSGWDITDNENYSVSRDNGNAISKSSSGSGNARANSHATGSGWSKTETNVTNGGNATSKAKANENNSTATASSKGGGHASASAESGGSGNASSTSFSEGNGSSKAVAIVTDGHAVATGIHDLSQNNTDNNSSLVPSSSMGINFNEPFFRPGYKPEFGEKTTTEFYIPPSTTEEEVKPMAFQMGRSLQGEFEVSEEKSTTRRTTPKTTTLPSTTENKRMMFQMGRSLSGAPEEEEEDGVTDKKPTKAAQVKTPKKKKKVGRRKEKKFQYARIP